MTKTTSGASQPDAELVNRARDLTARLRASAPESEASRRLSDDDIAALSEARLFELCVPKRLGGLQTNVRTLVDVIAAVAYGNGAAGWVVSLINTSAWMAALFPEQAQLDIWGSNPGERIATIFDAAGTAVPVAGGYRVSGKWGFGSGSLHAGWASLGVLLPGADGSGPDLALGLVPASEYTIKDTWFTAGMRGTGSNTIVAEDAFIPFHRIHSFDDIVEGRYRTEYTDEVLLPRPVPPGWHGHPGRSAARAGQGSARPHPGDPAETVGEVHDLHPFGRRANGPARRRGGGEHDRRRRAAPAPLHHRDRRARRGRTSLRRGCSGPARGWTPATRSA